MRITHEADYAIRMVYYLALTGERVSAKQISEKTGVSLRFALKILRKLIEANIIKSFKGVHGGYILNRAPSEVSLCEIIECIDGTIEINHCLSHDFNCTRVSLKTDCDFHNVFDSINQQLRYQLCEITFDRYLPSKT